MSRIAPSTRSAGLIGWLRFGVGIVMTFSPRPILRIPSGEEPSTTAVLLLRTIGVRDIVPGEPRLRGMPDERQSRTLERLAHVAQPVPDGRLLGRRRRPVLVAACRQQPPWRGADERRRGHARHAGGAPGCGARAALPSDRHWAGRFPIW